MKIADNQYCFVCGLRNPVGLKVTMGVDRESKSAACTIVIPSEYQGWKDMVYGGIISALLDEVCAYAGMTVGESVVTGELKIRFLKPVPVEQEVIVTARVVNHTRRTVQVDAQFTMKGQVLASAEGKMVIVRS
jgi:uncharacterized protein (TIGR00369 family)